MSPIKSLSLSPLVLEESPNLLFVLLSGPRLSSQFDTSLPLLLLPLTPKYWVYKVSHLADLKSQDFGK